jgi:uncharacterized coiled-coil DUF342 family protein
LLCGCAKFRPAEVAKPEPAPESVYERARKALHDVFWDKKNPESCRDIGHGLDASEAAEKKVLALAADNTRIEDELIQAEHERDEARAELEQVEADHMNCGAAIVVLRRERDEARARGRKLEEAMRAILDHEEHQPQGDACVRDVARAALASEPPSE